MNKPYKGFNRFKKDKSFAVSNNYDPCFLDVLSICACLSDHITIKTGVREVFDLSLDDSVRYWLATLSGFLFLVVFKCVLPFIFIPIAVISWHVKFKPEKLIEARKNYRKILAELDEDL